MLTQNDTPDVSVHTTSINKRGCSSSLHKPACPSWRGKRLGRLTSLRHRPLEPAGSVVRLCVGVSCVLAPAPDLSVTASCGCGQHSDSGVVAGRPPYDRHTGVASS